MGAPNKKGLDYFPKMVDFYDDDKIFDLMDEYGPLGVVVYEVILTIVYAQGYYLEISEDKLSRMVIRRIGNKWVRNQKAVVQVIHRCAELGLFDERLLGQGVITSEGIQRRYYEIAVKRMKRQLYSDKYWLLKKNEDGEPLLNAPKNQLSSEENGINSEETPLSSPGSPMKIKENKKRIYTPFPNPELEKLFQQFLTVQERSGRKIYPEQQQALRRQLENYGENDQERIYIVNRAIARGWKNFWPAPRAKPRKNNFNNFHQREYDFDELEKQLLNS